MPSDGGYSGEYPRTPFLATAIAHSGVTIEDVRRQLRELNEFIGRQNEMLDAEIEKTKREMVTGFTMFQMVKLATLMNRAGDPNLALALHDSMGDVLPEDIRSTLNVSIGERGKLAAKWMALAHRLDYTVDGVIDAIRDIVAEVPGVGERVSVDFLPDETSRRTLGSMPHMWDRGSASSEEFADALRDGRLDSIRVIADRRRGLWQYHLRKGSEVRSPTFSFHDTPYEIRAALMIEIRDMG